MRKYSIGDRVRVHHPAYGEQIITISDIESYDDQIPYKGETKDFDGNGVDQWYGEEKGKDCEDYYIIGLEEAIDPPKRDMSNYSEEAIQRIIKEAEALGLTLERTGDSVVTTTTTDTTDGAQFMQAEPWVTVREVREALVCSSERALRPLRSDRNT